MRHIAYWLDSTWCDDKQMPELASTDYDVVNVPATMIDEEIDDYVKRITQKENVLCSVLSVGR